MERAARGYVAGGAASGGAGRGGAVQAVAAAEAAHAPGADVFVGDLGAGQRGFRNLDEDGHAVHRQLVAGAGLEDFAADHSAGADRPWGELRKERRGTSFRRKKKWWGCGGRPARSATAASASPAGCL